MLHLENKHVGNGLTLLYWSVFLTFSLASLAGLVHTDANAATRINCLRTYDVTGTTGAQYLRVISPHTQRRNEIAAFMTFVCKAGNCGTQRCGWGRGSHPGTAGRRCALSPPARCLWARARQPSHKQNQLHLRSLSDA